MEKTREWKQYLMVVAGSALFAASVNLLIVPLSLYSAGIVGIAQILRTLLVPLMPFAAGFDVAGIINLLLNIPLFLLAFRSISRGFFWKTVISIIVQTAVMSLVPIPQEPILGDVLASCLIGGILSGLGVGLTLRSSGSCQAKLSDHGRTAFHGGQCGAVWHLRFDVQPGDCHLFDHLHGRHVQCM